MIRAGRAIPAGLRSQRVDLLRPGAPVVADDGTVTVAETLHEAWVYVMTSRGSEAMAAGWVRR